MREALQEKPNVSKYNRVLGRFKGHQAGPTLVVVAGMHGNEPSGILAVQTLLEELAGKEADFSGQLVALAGNLKALEQGKRFIDHDLNRMWKMAPDMVSLGKIPDAYEKAEMMELHSLVADIIESKEGPLVFLDLHTTSSESAPFLLCGDTLRNREFITQVPVPKILGLDEQLNGPFLSYINAQGHVSLVFEAGQHDSPDSYKNHLALLKVLLVRAGCLPEKAFENYQSNPDRLSAQSGDDLQYFFEVKHRFGISSADHFSMNPGYHNFREISETEPLAIYRDNIVPAPLTGRIFMPLYQEQGDDGFFVVRRIPNRRIRRSAFLRRIRFQRFLPLFPGISRHPEHEHMLIVDPKSFRRWGPSLLNVLGFRRMSRDGKQLIFFKRPFDLRGPSPKDKLPR